jgi:hypothetical protein
VVVTLPQQAIAVGYTTLTFNSSVFSSANVDMTKQHRPGFQWYFRNWFGNDSTATATFNADGSVTLNRTSITTVAISGDTWVGTAFGGGGYFEATFTFNPKFRQSRGWPAFWAMAQEHVAGLNEQWPGQPDGYGHFIETDFLEYFPQNDASGYHMGIRDFYGVWNSTCSGWCIYDPPGNPYTPSALKIDFTKIHKYGFLWVPATSEMMGSATWYYDDMPMRTITWSLYDGTVNVPVPNGRSWAFGVLDQQHLAVVVENGAGAITVTGVRVWQASNAGNISQ